MTDELQSQVYPRCTFHNLGIIYPIIWCYAKGIKLLLDSDLSSHRIWWGNSPNILKSSLIKEGQMINVCYSCFSIILLFRRTTIDILVLQKSYHAGSYRYYLPWYEFCKVLGLTNIPLKLPPTITFFAKIQITELTKKYAELEEKLAKLRNLSRAEVTSFLDDEIGSRLDKLSRQVARIDKRLYTHHEVALFISYSQNTNNDDNNSSGITSKWLGSKLAQSVNHAEILHFVGYM